MSFEKFDATIDIDDLSTAKVFDKTAFIQKQAFNDVERCVAETCKKIAGFKTELLILNNYNNSNYKRTHDTILVDGERGSGKSTFLINACEMLRNNQQYKLISLGIIDPTLITGKENIFILLIERVQAALLEWKKKNCGCTRRESRYEKWVEALRELSRGLKMLDDVGSSPLKQAGWDDAQYIMSEGLKDAVSGYNLERNFHKLVNEALELLEKDAFVLCFDDIDTDFSKGWPVLEIIRKYLTTPQVIVMLSGDYTLYSMLVRQQLWKMLAGRKFIEHTGKDAVQQMVDTLENQYLVKILPPSRRVRVRAAWELPKQLEITIPESLYSNSSLSPKPAVPLTALFFGLAFECYGFPVERCKSIGELFMHLPMRSIFEILMVINKHESIKKAVFKYLFSIIADEKLIGYDINEATNKTLENINTQNNPVTADKLAGFQAHMMYIYHDQLCSLGFTQDIINIMQWTGEFKKLSQCLSKENNILECANMLPTSALPKESIDILFLSGVYYSTLACDIRFVFHYIKHVLIFRDMLSKLKSSNYDKYISVLKDNDVLPEMDRDYSEQVIVDVPEGNDIHLVFFESIAPKDNTLNLLNFFDFLELISSDSSEFKARMSDCSRKANELLKEKNEKLQVFMSDICDWAARYHDGRKTKGGIREEIDRLRRALPPYVIEIIFKDFKECIFKERSSLLTIQTIGEQFITSIENAVKDFKDNEFHDAAEFTAYIKSCPLWKAIGVKFSDGKQKTKKNASAEAQQLKTQRRTAKQKPKANDSAEAQQPSNA